MAQALPYLTAGAAVYSATQGGGDTTITSTDPATQARYDDLYNKAQGIAQQPFVPYTGGRVAGFNPDQFAGFDATRNMFNQSMGFNPRNQLNNLANMSAPSVNLPFGYNQPQQPSPIFQPMPITGGSGGRPTPPPSFGGIGGGGPIFTSPNPTTNMNIETRDTGFGPVTISSPGFSGAPTIGGNVPRGGGINNVGPGLITKETPATFLQSDPKADEEERRRQALMLAPSRSMDRPRAPSINFQNDERFGQPITTRIGRNGQEIPVYGFHNNVPGGGGINYGSMGGGLFSGGPVALPGGQLPQAEKDFQNTSMEDRLQFLKDKGIEIPPNFLTALPPPRDPGRYDSIGMPLLTDPRNRPPGDGSSRRPQPGFFGKPGVTVPRPDPILRPRPPIQRPIRPGLPNPPQSPTGQITSPIMQQAATVRPVERFGGANITQLANFGGANIDPVERFGAANISPVDLYSGASVNRGDVRDVTPRSLLDTDLGAYQNPFQSQVIDNTLDDLNRARQLQIQSDQDAAIGRGAFGGSRSALLESETNRNFAEQAARTAGDLRARGFDTATSLAGQDIGRQFEADRFMSDADRAIAMQNATFGQQAGLARQGLLGDVSLNQARLDQQAGLAGMDAANRRALQQGQFQQQAGMADMDAFNRAVMQDAQFRQQAGMAGADAYNRAGSQQAQLDASRFAANQNALNQMNMGMFDAANRAAFMQPQLDMQNRQFQAGLLNDQLSDQYRSLGLLSGIGRQQQGLQQAGMDAGYNEFLRALGYGPQQLGLLSSSVFGMNPGIGQTTTTEQGLSGQIGSALDLYNAISPLFDSGS